MGVFGLPFFLTMATSTIDTDTELSAVNSILGSIGQSPITTLGAYTELIGETTYTGNGSLTTYAIGITFTSATQIKASLDGVATTAFSVSGSNVVFSSAPGNGVAIRIYREEEKYNTLENPEVSFIYNILCEVNKDVQNEGWHFNTEYHKKLTLTTAGEISIPANTLRYDFHDGLNDKLYDVVTRSGKLYDLVEHTATFEAGDYYIDAVTLYPFADLPNPFQRYITYRSAVRAATQLVSNPQLVQLLQSQEAMSRATCMEYECDKGDNSFFGVPHESRYQSYQPYQALSR